MLNVLKSYSVNDMLVWHIHTAEAWNEKIGVMIRGEVVFWQINFQTVLFAFFTSLRVLKTNSKLPILSMNVNSRVFKCTLTGLLLDYIVSIIPKSTFHFMSSRWCTLFSITIPYFSLKDLEHKSIVNIVQSECKVLWCLHWIVSE